jgi:hypothetical protein
MLVFGRMSVPEGDQFIVMADRNRVNRNKVKVVQVEPGTTLYPKKPSPQCKGVKRIVWSRGSTSGRIADANYKVAEVLCEKLNAAPLAVQAVELAGDKAVREYAEHIVATEIMGKL